MSTSLIRPGLMVSLRTSISGGVFYSRKDLEATKKQTAASEGADVTRWETTKVVEDPQEHERATQVRNAARALIARCCASTPFGLLCPEMKEEVLDSNVEEARRLVDEFNRTAKHSRVFIYVLKGRIASSDEEAARAIGAEVSSLISQMNGAIDRLDPKAIRDAATRATQMSSMLSPEQMVKVTDAVKEARDAARAIVKRIEKDGEQAAVVLGELQRTELEKARTAFLDFSEDLPDNVTALPQAGVAQRFAGLNLDDDGLDRAAGEAN